MNSPLTIRINQNRSTQEARTLRHQQADDAIHSHYTAISKQAADTLSELLDEQRALLGSEGYTLEETARAVVEEFQRSLESINQMPQQWAAGEVTHYDKANAKATREYLSDNFLTLAEHMAFLGTPPARPEHTLWELRDQIIDRDPDLLEEAFLIANQIQSSKKDGVAAEPLNSLFLKVLDHAKGDPWCQDRLRNVRQHLDRTVRFRRKRRNTTWAMID